MYTSSDTGPGRGHYPSRTQINARGPKRVHHSSHLIEVRPEALGRIWHLPGNHKLYTLADAILEWLREGLLFKLDSNKRWRDKMQPIFESFPGPLLKSGWSPWPDMVTTRKP